MSNAHPTGGGRSKHRSRYKRFLLHRPERLQFNSAFVSGPPEPGMEKYLTPLPPSLPPSFPASLPPSLRSQPLSTQPPRPCARAARGCCGGSETRVGGSKRASEQRGDPPRAALGTPCPGHPRGERGRERTVMPAPSPPCQPRPRRASPVPAGTGPFPRRRCRAAKGELSALGRWLRAVLGSLWRGEGMAALGWTRALVLPCWGQQPVPCPVPPPWEGPGCHRAASRRAVN